ncbi:MAG: K(+)-transporting ATPase subunit [Bacteroidetes bacterium]|nr:K(+)-transporting ATPase subunit [Bacteroidota bacterium]
MKFSGIFSAFRLTIICLVFFSVLYPLAITGIAQFAPAKGKGETVEVNGKIVGFQKIGQSFTDSIYFLGRPSAVNYNAAGSGGSNKGPSNPDYLKEVQARIDAFLVRHPYLQKKDIPADLVTASGSGLDPDISAEAALVQVKRIAQVRKIPEEKVKQLVEKNIQKPLWGMFGTEKVNVLELNIELNSIR